MKEKGVIRRVDDLGRVVIPKEFRESLGLSDGLPVEILNRGDSVVIRPYPVDGEIHPYLKNLERAVEKQSWMDGEDKARILEMVKKLGSEIDESARAQGNESVF